MSAIFVRPAIVLLFVATTLALSLGCGEKITSTTSASTVEASAPATETPIALPQPEPDQPTLEQQATEQEQANPFVQGSTEAQSVGTTIDGLQLKDIRWADHGSYLRLVFEMATLDGQPVLQVPHAEASMEPGNKQIKLVLGGIRSLGASANVSASEVSVGDDLVLALRRVPSYDDQALVYLIDLARPSSYSLLGLGSPGRIVIDVAKS